MRTGPEFSRPVMNSIGEYLMFCNLAHFENFAKTVEVGLKSTYIKFYYLFNILQTGYLTTSNCLLHRVQ